MKIKLSNYIADFLVDKGIKVGFTVVGGGAMHLNDSFGHKSGLKTIMSKHALYQQRVMQNIIINQHLYV